MNTAIAAVSLIAGLFVLAGLAGAIVVYIRGTARDLETKRLREDRDDYLSRIDYIEPRYEACKVENELLHKLVDPTKRLDALDATEAERHRQLLAALDRQGEQLKQIETRVHVPHKEES